MRTIRAGNTECVGEMRKALRSVNELEGSQVPFKVFQYLVSTNLDNPVAIENGKTKRDGGAVIE
jgi:hypothetical protein